MRSGSGNFVMLFMLPCVELRIFFRLDRFHHQLHHLKLASESLCFLSFHPGDRSLPCGITSKLNLYREGCFAIPVVHHITHRFPLLPPVYILCLSALPLQSLLPKTIMHHFGHNQVTNLQILCSIVFPLQRF